MPEAQQQRVENVKGHDPKSGERIDLPDGHVIGISERMTIDSYGLGRFVKAIDNPAQGVNSSQGPGNFRW